jgi:hypothetical protein
MQDGCAALVDYRGHARAHADHVGRQPETAGDVLIDVAVRVDHPRQHQLARDIHHLSGGRWDDAVLDGGDSPIADGNVLDAVDA